MKNWLRYVAYRLQIPGFQYGGFTETGKQGRENEIKKVSNAMMERERLAKSSATRRERANTTLFLVLSLSLAELYSVGDRCTNIEHWWNDTDGENRSTRDITCPSAILFINTHVNWPGSELGDGLVNNCLSHGMTNTLSSAM